MASLLTTVWLVLAALSFAAIMEHAGFLERLLRPVVKRVYVKKASVKKTSVRRHRGLCVTDIGFGRYEMCRSWY